MRSSLIVRINKKFNPLFNRPKGVDTFILTGGRSSFKSYTAAIAAVYYSDELEHRILYARYTNVSSKDSVFPEVEEKIQLLGKEDRFNITTNRMDSTTNNGKIVFKGLKAGSGNQTANLKSLTNFSCVIFEEAEEIPDYDTYEKVALSIRGNGVGSAEPNIKILILNPAINTHWVHKEFFERMGVADGFNGVKDNVCYIHTSYLDGLEFVPQDILNSFNRMKELNPDRYHHVVMGGWLNEGDGIVKRNMFEYFELSEIEGEVYHLTADTAYTSKTTNDPSAVLKYVIKDNCVYILDVFTGHLEFPELVEVIQDMAHPKGWVYVEPKASGKSIVQFLKRNTKLYIKEDTPPTQDKVTRLNAVLPFIESGRVKLLKNALYLDSFLTEVTTFPASTHDDQVDVLVMAVSKLNTPTTWGEKYMKK